MPSKRALVLVLLASAAAAACSTPPERLTIDGRAIALYNDSGETWSGVEIWVNDHYRVTRDVVAPGERFDVPLETFVAGFGQRFRRDQPVTGIEVTATDAGGDPVRIVWGTGRRR